MVGSVNQPILCRLIDLFGRKGLIRCLGEHELCHVHHGIFVAILGRLLQPDEGLVPPVLTRLRSAPGIEHHTEARCTSLSLDFVSGL